jgi:hypothetical protein
MPKVLGMSLGTFIVRLLGALVSGAVSILIFLLLPRLASENLPQGVLGFTGSEILFYGILIAILSGLQIIFRDRWVGDASAVGNGIIQIYYLYTITNGGVMAFSMGGTEITVSFATLLYFLMLPSALSIVSGVYRAFTRSSLQKFQDAEEIVLR